MVLQAGSLAYAVGNLLAQPAKVYATGAGVVTTIKAVLIGFGIFQGINAGSSSLLAKMVIEWIHTMFPIYYSAEGVVISIIINLLVGIAVWTGNWNIGMALR